MSDSSGRRKWDSPWKRIALIVAFLGGGGWTFMQVTYKMTLWLVTVGLSSTFETVEAHCEDQLSQSREFDLKLQNAMLRSADVFWDRAIDRGLIEVPVRHRRRRVNEDDVSR